MPVKLDVGREFEDEGHVSEPPPIPAPRATPRARAAWRAWLEALAVDAEAAIAAALTYSELDAHARDVFLDAVDEDAETMRTPRIAIYAPLLAVESDPARRLRLTSAITRDEPLIFIVFFSSRTFWIAKVV